MHSRLKSIESGNFFFNHAASICKRPICSYNSAIRASWFSTLRRPSPENNSAAPSSNCRFHCPICVGWTPNCEASSLVVRSPRTAANAALAFNAASIRRRFAAMPFSQKLDQSYQGFDSKSWSSFLGPL